MRNDTENAQEKQDVYPNIPTSGAEASQDSNPDGVPPNFRLTKEGVFYVKNPDGDGTHQELVCSRLEIRALTHDERGENWGRMLVTTDRNGTEHAWAMPMEMLAGDGTEYRRILLSLGL